MRQLIEYTVRRFIKDERGVTLVEYGIAIALAITLGAGALSLLATDIGTSLGIAGDKMITVDPGTGG